MIYVSTELLGYHPIESGKLLAMRESRILNITLEIIFITFFMIEEGQRFYPATFDEMINPVMNT